MGAFPATPTTTAPARAPGPPPPLQRGQAEWQAARRAGPTSSVPPALSAGKRAGGEKMNKTLPATEKPTHTPCIPPRQHPEPAPRSSHPRPPPCSSRRRGGARQGQRARVGVNRDAQAGQVPPRCLPRRGPAPWAPSSAPQSRDKLRPGCGEPFAPTHPLASSRARPTEAT